jgi:hypothetical protein
MDKCCVFQKRLDFWVNICYICFQTNQKEFFMAYRAEDGSVHDTEEGAQQANEAAANMARTGNPYGMTPESVGGGLKAFVVLPYYLAKICCSMFAKLFNLGTAGKVIQSVILGAVAYTVMIFLMPLLLLPFPEKMRDSLVPLLTVVSVLSFLGPTAWYFLKHYNVVKAIWEGDDGDNSFRSLVLISFIICFYGFALAIIASLSSQEASVLITLVTAVAAIIVYIKRLKPFIEYAAANAGKTK